MNKNILSKNTNVIIINDFDYIQGGASKVSITTANQLVEKNIKVYFFYAKHSNSTTLDKRVIKICTNQDEALKDKNKLRGFINGLYNFKAKRKLNKLLNNLDKEKTIIHVHGWTKILSCSIFNVIFKKKFKVVLTMHDYFTACPNGGYYNYKENKICKLNPLSYKCIKCNCDSRNYFFKVYRILRTFIQNKIVKLNKKLTNVISISDFSEKILVKTLNKNVNIHRVYNPIDYDKNIKNIDFNKNDYYLNVCRLSKEKGVDVFCEAIKRTGVKGIVVGDGPLKEKLQKNYPEVEFVGWKNNFEVKEYMKNAKYLVFTSNLYEAAPLTTMEALMMGLPCIVWKNCAAIDQISIGKNGFSYNNVSDLCDVILNKKIEKFIFEYKYDYVKNLIDVYKKILES